MWFKRPMQMTSRVAHRPPRIRVEARSVASYLESAPAGVDLAFIDPPYDLGESEMARGIELLAPRLAEGANVVVRRKPRSPEPTWPDGIAPERRRDYGETTLWWAAPAAQPETPSQPA